MIALVLNQSLTYLPGGQQLIDFVSTHVKTYLLLHSVHCSAQYFVSCARIKSMIDFTAKSMSNEDKQAVTLHREGRVGVITLNCPEKVISWSMLILILFSILVFQMLAHVPWKYVYSVCYA